MRLLDLFLATLLCLAIPLQGFAGILASPAPCPAETAGLVAADADNEQSCCNDAETANKTGKSCKAEQNCQIASPGILNQTLSRTWLADAIKITPFRNSLALSDEPSATWRPPDSL